MNRCICVVCELGKYASRESQLHAEAGCSQVGYPSLQCAS